MSAYSGWQAEAAAERKLEHANMRNVVHEHTQHIQPAPTPDLAHRLVVRQVLTQNQRSITPIWQWRALQLLLLQLLLW
jgi:hypothetical protein